MNSGRNTITRAIQLQSQAAGSAAGHRPGTPAGRGSFNAAIATLLVERHADDTLRLMPEQKFPK